MPNVFLSTEKERERRQCTAENWLVGFWQLNKLREGEPCVPEKAFLCILTYQNIGGEIF